MKQHYSKAN